ncbi:hypothetical protein LP419_17725 [Massilia sp. H-1]|nr:hypothetical protein LP419_17725 [Massilia sp. H-1]
MVARPGALLIPCVGFNGERFRLGYGGGYYDRTLAPAPRPVTAGVAYQCLAADFASAPHDVALDRVLTEAEAPCKANPVKAGPGAATAPWSAQPGSCCRSADRGRRPPAGVRTAG